MAKEMIDHSPNVSDPPNNAEAPGPAAAPADLPELDPQNTTGEQPVEVPVDPSHVVDMLGDVELDVKIELGRCQMYVGDVLRLSPGSVVELDKLAGDPVDVYVNERLVARGEVLVVNDNFCVRVNDVLSAES
jgi:flagellar motor switch protein FliN